MSRLTELLRQAHKVDPQLGADLEAEIVALTKRRTFGLVFEQHQPEAVEVPGRQVRRGDKVRVLPARGETRRGDERLWRVTQIGRADDRQLAHVEELGAENPDAREVSVTDLVVVAEFRDKIYPGLVETGRVERGGDKPFHTVINAENYHALEMLAYTHRHSIDAIYIDPPYNTGARDWKYNNNYVESDDDYRHSKWLAFMERRLLVARELLNPEDSVLIVTIDEKEYLRLGILLEQTFPEARQQMVTTVISQRGVARDGTLSRVNEYIFLVFFGDSRAAESSVDLLGSVSAEKPRQMWFQFRRNGAGSLREDSPNLFYPLLMDPETRRINQVGDPLPLTLPRDQYQVPDGLVALWPLREDGTEARWRTGVEVARRNVERGYLRVGAFNKKNGLWPVLFINEGGVRAIESDEVPLIGRADSGEVILRSATREKVLPKTVWNSPSHDAGWHGSRMLTEFLPGRRFPYPKSLFAVEDVLRLFVTDKLDAVVLDFFSGSGTTAHAVMRLNRQDGGRRQCISVTNNEVAVDEQRTLRAKSLRPGDSDWEKWGICDYITKPRIEAAITGRTPLGEGINGDYKFTDEFPMAEGFEENAAFFTLTYEASLSVRHHRAFARIAPILWLQAGSKGRIITNLGEDGWDVADTYGVLENLDRADQFLHEVEQTPAVRMAFIVTDDETAFQMVCRDLPTNVTALRLYESYFQNFEINTGRSL